MTKFIFSVLPLQAERMDGEIYWQVLLNLATGSEHRREVEAKNVKELQPLFDTYCADMTATGKPWECGVRMASSRERKPAGFDKATNWGGALSRKVNTEIAIAECDAKAAAKAEAKAAA